MPGIPAWVAYAGKDSTVKATAIKSGGEEGSIDNDLFTKIVKEDPSSIYIIDVRDPAEFATGSFKTAKEYSGGSTRSQNTESARHQADCVCLRNRRAKW